MTGSGPARFIDVDELSKCVRLSQSTNCWPCVLVGHVSWRPLKVSRSKRGGRVSGKTCVQRGESKLQSPNLRCRGEGDLKSKKSIPCSPWVAAARSSTSSSHSHAQDRHIGAPSRRHRHPPTAGGHCYCLCLFVHSELETEK